MVEQWEREIAGLGFTPPYNAHRSAGEITDLYFVAFEDLLKIGISTDIDRRMRELRMGCPRGLTLRKTRKVPRCFARQTERLVHAALSDCRFEGEWFRVDLDRALSVADPFIRAARSADRIHINMLRGL